MLLPMLPVMLLCCLLLLSDEALCKDSLPSVLRNTTLQQYTLTWVDCR